MKYSRTSRAESSPISASNSFSQGQTRPQFAASLQAFLSGAFKQAKRLGILDGINPVMDLSIPRAPELEEDTYAYNLSEIKTMLAVLPNPTWTVVQTAAFTGLRKSEIRGLAWENFDGKELSVKRSVWGTKKLAEKLEGNSAWGGVANEPKTKRSRASIPVVKQLADSLEAHRLRMGILAQPGLPIFQAGNGQPFVEPRQSRAPRHRAGALALRGLSETRRRAQARGTRFRAG